MEEEKLVEVYKKKKQTGNYVFPSILANIMKKVSTRTQLEAEMMSISCILLGILVLGFITLFSGLSGWVKFITIINMCAAFVLLSSRLVTSFQQYQNYLNSMGLIEEWNAPEMGK